MDSGPGRRGPTPEPSTTVPLSREALNRITGEIIDAAIYVHRGLGPGLLESVYVAVLAFELRKRGLHVVTQVPVPVTWESVHLDVGFRIDLLVEQLVVVEVKALAAVAPVHKQQLLTYLRLSNRRVGLLINFNVELLKDGVSRVVNGLPE